MGRRSYRNTRGLSARAAADVGKLNRALDLVVDATDVAAVTAVPAIDRLRVRIAEALTAFDYAERDPRHIEAMLRSDANDETIEAIEAMTKEDFDRRIVELVHQLEQCFPGAEWELRAGVLEIPPFAYVPLLGSDAQADGATLRAFQEDAVIAGRTPDSTGVAE